MSVNIYIWMFPKMVVPQNGWFILGNLIKMDDLGGKPPIFGNIYTSITQVNLHHHSSMATNLLHSTIGFIHSHITAGHKVSLGVSCRHSSNPPNCRGGKGGVCHQFPNHHVAFWDQRFGASLRKIQVAIVNFAERERPWAQFTITWSFSNNEQTMTLRESMWPFKKGPRMTGKNKQTSIEKLFEYGCFQK